MSDKQEPEDGFAPLDRHLVIDESGVRFYDGTAQDHGAPSGEGVTMEIAPDGKAFFSGEVQTKVPQPSRWEAFRKNGRLFFMGLAGVFAGGALIIVLIGPITPFSANLPIFPGHSAQWDLNLHPDKDHPHFNSDSQVFQGSPEAASSPQLGAATGTGSANGSGSTMPVGQSPSNSPVQGGPIGSVSSPPSTGPVSGPTSSPTPSPAPTPTPTPIPSPLPPPNSSPPQSHPPVSAPHPASGPVAAPISPSGGINPH